jgi:cullin-associated NEDD8-dissociated protein 1
MLETCVAKIGISEFIQKVVAGISDESQEIIVLNYLTLQKLSQIAPAALIQNLDALLKPLKAVLLSKPKSNAVKQELERTKELVRSAVRTIITLSKMPGIDSQSPWYSFVSEAKSSSADILQVFESVEEEMTGNSLIGVSHSNMEL